MSWTGNVEENFKIWFQKFKTSKPNRIKCAHFLHVAGEMAIVVYNALSFTDAEKGIYNTLICKYSNFIEGKKAHERFVEVILLVRKWFVFGGRG